MCRPGCVGVVFSPGVVASVRPVVDSWKASLCSALRVSCPSDGVITHSEASWLPSPGSLGSLSSQSHSSSSSLTTSTHSFNGRPQSFTTAQSQLTKLAHSFFSLSHFSPPPHSIFTPSSQVTRPPSRPPTAGVCPVLLLLPAHFLPSSCLLPASSATPAESGLP